MLGCLAHHLGLRVRHKYIIIDQANQCLLGTVEIGHRGELPCVFDTDIGQRFRLRQDFPGSLLLVKNVDSIFDNESDRAFCFLLHEDEVSPSSICLLPCDLVKVDVATVGSVFEVVEVQVRVFLKIDTLPD